MAVTYTFQIPEIRNTSYRRPYYAPEIPWMERKWRMQAYEGTADFKGDLCIKVDYCQSSASVSGFYLTLRLIPQRKFHNIICQGRRGKADGDNNTKTAGGFLFRKVLQDGSPYLVKNSVFIEITLEIQEEVVYEVGVKEWEEESQEVSLSQERRKASAAGSKLIQPLLKRQNTKEMLRNWVRNREGKEADDNQDRYGSLRGDNNNVASSDAQKRSTRTQERRSIKETMKSIRKKKEDKVQGDEEENIQNLFAAILKNNQEIQENENTIQAIIHNLQEGEKRIQGKLTALQKNLSDILENEATVKANSDAIYDELKYYKTMYLRKYSSNSYEDRKLPLPICLLCKRRPIGRLLLPCNHCCVCPPCASILALCPRCSTKIRYIVKYYY